MMDWTDRHCRYFMRLLSPSAFLYTEMVTANAIHYGDADALLRHSGHDLQPNPAVEPAPPLADVLSHY